MKNLFKASLVASAVLAASTVLAQDNGIHTGTSDPLIDGQGDCIIAPGGTYDCNPEPAPAPQPTTQTLSGDALFAYDKSNLSAQGEAEIDRIARSVQNAVAVEVVGHTDSRGSDQYNQALSERRAATVANALAARGISPNIISMRGMGESNPIATNETAAGRQANRRVDITVVNQQAQ